jgi:glycosyltransferase involved in cell wall biosynthesis
MTVANSPGTILFLILDMGLTIENSVVFQAQIVDQVIALRKLGYPVAVLCASRDRSKFQFAAGNKLEEYQVPVHLVSDLGFLKNIFSFATALRSLKRSQKIGRIYIRGYWAAFPIFLASPMGRLSYVYDVRGECIDEAAARGSAAWRLFLIRIFETFALRRARYVSCVTNRLASVVQARARLNTLPEVIPSCIDLSDFSFSEETRTIRRTELGYTDEDIVLLYSGGMAHYQMIAEMFALWRGVFPLNRHIKFLLMINSDPPSLERSVGRLDDFGSRLTLLNLERSEVFATLIAADIGFLLREDRELNATASPVKFAEYLAAGLAVVSSPGVGDLSDRIIKRNLGVLVKPLRQSPEVPKLASFIRSFEKDRPAFRNRALLAAREKYSWEAYRDTYQKLYAQPATK